MNNLMSVVLRGFAKRFEVHGFAVKLHVQALGSGNQFFNYLLKLLSIKVFPLIRR